MFYWIYDLPTWRMVVMFTMFFVGFYWLGSIFIRPFLLVLLRKQPGVNDLVGYLLGSHGVFYGILLGLLAVSAYQNFNDSDASVAIEAGRLAALYRDVSAYPPPHRGTLQEHLRTYTDFVIHEAWPQQQRGIVPTKGTELITDFQLELMAFEPKTPGQEILHGETLRQFNALVEARQKRLHAATSGIPPILWYVVLLGGAVTVVLIWLMDMKLVANFLLGGVLSFFLATVIALIAAMDNPFRGQVSIGSDSYERVYNTLMKSEKLASSTPAAP